MTVNPTTQKKIPWHHHVGFWHRKTRALTATSSRGHHPAACVLEEAKLPRCISFHKPDIPVLSGRSVAHSILPASQIDICGEVAAGVGQLWIWNLKLKYIPAWNATKIHEHPIEMPSQTTMVKRLNHVEPMKMPANPFNSTYHGYPWLS